MSLGINTFTIPQKSTDECGLIFYNILNKVNIVYVFIFLYIQYFYRYKRFIRYIILTARMKQICMNKVE